MSNRDEFPEDTKRKVALRANHQCSFHGCPQPTSGPSDESPEAVNMIGKAAHIHAAAPGPGARRYLASMSREERTHINNAIWLCATHADLIDRDEVTYTADMLRAMKSDHEAKCAERQRNALSTGEAVPDLVAIGPNIVFIGEFLGVEAEVWSFHLRNFVDGDVHALIALAERYERTKAIERYVLVNELGDGRRLRDKPSITRETTGGYMVRCPVFPSADRIRASDLPKSWALSGSDDLVVQGGNWAITSGLEALPQQMKTYLSHQRGESPFHQDFGTRFAEYYNLLVGSPWFARYLKLEVIRQAAIPYTDLTNDQQHTPLRCVKRVYGVEVLASTPTNNWLPIRVDLDVNGVGRWRNNLSVYIPSEPIIAITL
ncbi:HNH endonuclease [Acidithiobacillus thiooxidans]|uniref:HNH endonuclease n=1 Tax=Acidithiobacillus thiooxidans TaxID=930 RepID=UPI0005528840|nr:HNH endonuclease [Acidithiobacillus thiooxidans]